MLLRNSKKNFNLIGIYKVHEFFTVNAFFWWNFQLSNYQVLFMTSFLCSKQKYVNSWLFIASLFQALKFNLSYTQISFIDTHLCEKWYFNAWIILLLHELFLRSVLKLFITVKIISNSRSKLKNCWKALQTVCVEFIIIYCV